MNLPEWMFWLYTDYFNYIELHHLYWMGGATPAYLQNSPFATFGVKK
jgi:hypothetical protein